MIRPNDITAPQKFPLGRLLVTCGAMAALERTGEDPTEYIARHAIGDWGELDAEDKRANDEAIKNGTRILSAFHLKDNTKIWVISEASDPQGNREATTILLPDEY